MSRAAYAVVLSSLFLASSGCTKTERLVGHREEHAGQYYGEVGITGHQNKLTIERGSDLDKLSIIGDGNVVHVQDRVVLAKIEIWGENNIVDVPRFLIVRDYIVGTGSRILRREPGPGPRPIGPEGEPLERLPIDPGPERELQVQPRAVAPQDQPQPSGGATPATLEPASGGSPPPPSSGGSNTSISPAGDRVIPPAGVSPGGQP